MQIITRSIFATGACDQEEDGGADVSWSLLKRPEGSRQQAVSGSISAWILKLDRIDISTVIYSIFVNSN